MVACFGVSTVRVCFAGMTEEVRFVGPRLPIVAT